MSTLFTTQNKNIYKKNKPTEVGYKCLIRSCAMAHVYLAGAALYRTCVPCPYRRCVPLFFPCLYRSSILWPPGNHVSLACRYAPPTMPIASPQPSAWSLCFFAMSLSCFSCLLSVSNSLLAVSSEVKALCCELCAFIVSSLAFLFASSKSANL